MEEFIAVKGLKAKGNQLTKDTVNTIDLLEPIPYEPPASEKEPPNDDGNDDEGLKEAEEAADSEKATTVELEVEDTTKTEEPKPEPKKEKPKTPPPTDSGEGQLGLF